MIRKRVFLLLVLFISLSFFGNYQQTDGMFGDYQRIELNCEEISWSMYDQYNDTTIFEIVSNVTIHNKNDYPVDLTFPTPVIQMIGTNASINLDDDSLGGFFFCVCGSFEQVLDYGTIQQGYSSNISKSYIHLNNGSLNALPDGTYLFWYHLYGINNALNFITNQVLLTIASGVPTIDYNYGATTGLSIHGLIPLFSIACLTIIIVNVKKRKK